MGARRFESSLEETGPKRSRSWSCHAFQARVISSLLRATKFHHISIGSPRGSPPRTRKRVSSPAPSIGRVSAPGGTRASHPGSTMASSTFNLWLIGITAYSKPASAGISIRCPWRVTSRPTVPQSTSAGDRFPSSSPIITFTSPAGRSATGRSGMCSNLELPCRVSSGWASHICTPWIPSVVPNSACAMPLPADIRFSCPGLIACSLPSESVCSASPSSNQVTVDRPVWGCGPTSRG